MIASFARRLFLIFITLCCLSLVSYHILMRDPLNAALAEPYFYSGYIHYLQGLLRGDLGISYNGGESLLQLLFAVIPPTIELCFFAMLLALLFGVPFGLVAAFNRHNLCGKSIRALSSLGLSVPVFWIAPLLLYLSAIHHWDIASMGQYNLLYQIKTITGFNAIDVWFVQAPYRLKVIQNVFQHLVLPAIVLAISPTMEVTRLVQQRAEYLFQQNYVKVSSTKGWSTWKILRKLILRNTLPLIMPQFTRIFTLVLAQCMLVENVFGWPGVGSWLISAVAQQDYNAISAGIIAIGLIVIIINQFTDFLVFLLDPLHRKGWYAR
ncbi:cationic peptide transport system permease protein [Volucribacter psittacicida]|uniref:Cationic peptide transport system permease protein n=1 Tax=Volucribacter psittacicida TaxID=203482 RepID=A0A4R1FV05_9PAST|nr:ABC transporter permease subunit [Volucribacter psittacicida]TCJ98673.1 cationic peptide transport system permease protein [Volucribacter psittacicida]